MAQEPTDIVSVWPPRAVAGGLEPGFSRYEPLVSPEVLRNDYLFGIPLKSNMDGAIIEDSDLQRHINRAISEVEHELKIMISPVEFEVPFDYNIADYRSYNWIQVPQYPIIQVLSVRAQFPNSEELYEFPSEWYAVDNEHGLVRLAPTNAHVTSFFMTNELGYLPLILGTYSTFPQLWRVRFIAGFQHGKIPAAVNDLIGTIAALKVLGMLAPVLFPYSGYSIGLDGVSQSVSTAGVQQLKVRLTELQEQRDKLMVTLQRSYGKNLQIMAL